MRAGDSQHLKVDLEINEDDKVNLESRRASNLDKNIKLNISHSLYVAFDNLTCIFKTSTLSKETSNHHKQHVFLRYHPLIFLIICWISLGYFLARVDMILRNCVLLHSLQGCGQRSRRISGAIPL